MLQLAACIACVAAAADISDGSGSSGSEPEPDPTTTTTTVTVTTTTTTTTPACADGEYRNGTTCTAKTEQASCNPGEKFTAGNNTDKTTDDAFCTECANGTYTGTPTTCTAKRTHVDCSEIEKFEGGEDSNKTVDDTTCTECKDGSYKFRPTSCKTKKKNCKNSETFTAGSDAEKTRDDTTCTTTTDAPSADFPASCSDEGKGKARKGKEYARIGTVKSNAVCAAACAADAGKCVYYRLHRSRGCDLLEKPGDEINSGSFIGHGGCTGGAGGQSPTTASAGTTAVPVAFPATCTAKKAGAACQGRNYKVISGLHDNACAGACAADTSCYYWLSSPAKGCIMKSTARKCKPDSRFTSHGTCSHDHIQVQGCEKLGAYYGFRGKKVGNSKLAMTNTACMQACSELVDNKGNKICKYWIRHNSKGCLMYSSTKGKEMFKKKGIPQHGNCNGGTPLTNGWVCPDKAANDGCQ